MSPFQPLVYIQDLEQIDCVTREKFQSTIYVQNATVFPSNLTSNFARVKCGNITSGFLEVL